MTERLYRLPNGSALLLSQVEQIQISAAASEVGTGPCVALRIADRHSLIEFDTLLAAVAFADEVRPLIDAARAAAAERAADAAKHPDVWLPPAAPPA